MSNVLVSNGKPISSGFNYAKNIIVKNNDGTESSAQDKIDTLTSDLENKADIDLSNLNDEGIEVVKDIIADEGYAKKGEVIPLDSIDYSEWKDLTEEEKVAKGKIIVTNYPDIKTVAELSEEVEELKNKPGIRELTRAEYDNLPEEEINNGTVYNTTDENEDPFKAENVDYKDGKSVADGLDDLNNNLSHKFEWKLLGQYNIKAGITFQIPQQIMDISFVSNESNFVNYMASSAVIDGKFNASVNVHNISNSKIYPATITGTVDENSVNIQEHSFNDNLTYTPREAVMNVYIR